MKQIICALFFGLFTVGIQAAVLAGQSPAGLMFGGWQNNDDGQNFLVQFTLSNASDITGFDIYTGHASAIVGTGVTVKIRADVAGSPDLVNLFQFTDSIDSEVAFESNIDISSVDFGAISLSAGTYWMGVSGASRDIGWYSFNNNGIHTPTYQRQLGGNNIAVTPTIFELAYQVRGEEQITSAVPEPETYALMLAGLGLVGAVARRRKHRASTA